eukprot:1316212-Pleurochrysis_carterae.AAC.2
MFLWRWPRDGYRGWWTRRVEGRVESWRGSRMICEKLTKYIGVERCRGVIRMYLESTLLFEDDAREDI